MNKIFLFTLLALLSLNATKAAKVVITNNDFPFDGADFNNITLTYWHGEFWDNVEIPLPKAGETTTTEIPNRTYTDIGIRSPVQKSIQPCLNSLGEPLRGPGKFTFKAQDTLALSLVGQPSRECIIINDLSSEKWEPASQ